MTVSFRSGRYLLALLWHWSLPFTFGAVFASVLAIHGVQQGVELLDEALDASIRRVTDSCTSAAPEQTPFIDYPERSDPSEDLVSQHWREAASLWVARRAQGETLTKRRTNVQSEGASKRHGGSLPATWGSPERARGNPYQASHEGAKAKVQLILKESLAQPGIRLLTLAPGGQERKGSLPAGPRQTAPPFGLVAKQ